MTGKHEKMVQDGKITIQLDPESFARYSNLAYGHLFLGRLGEAETAMQRAFERKAEDPVFLFLRYDIAFLRADQAGMQRQVALSEGKPGDEDLMADREAFTLACAGHLQQARSMTRRAADVAQQASQKDSAALYETGAAVLWKGQAQPSRSSLPRVHSRKAPPACVAWPIWPHTKEPKPSRSSRKFSITAGL